MVEFAAIYPCKFKVRQAQRKWVLRQVLYRHVPQGLDERPKKGFSAPVRQWLCGPLRDWVETLLDAQRLRARGCPMLAMCASMAGLSGRSGGPDTIYLACCGVSGVAAPFTAKIDGVAHVGLMCKEWLWRCRRPCAGRVGARALSAILGAAAKSAFHASKRGLSVASRVIMFHS